jgi:hypothetical protein
MTIHLATIRYGSQVFQSELAESCDERNFEDLVAKLFREHNWRVMPISSAYKSSSACHRQNR